VSYSHSVRCALLALVLCGCPQGDAQPDAPGDAFVFVDIDARLEGGSAELGTGTTAFEPLVEDQELGLVAGPQGGFHFIVHSRIREMAPGDYMRPGVTENPVTLFAVYSEDGRQIDKMYPPYHIGYMQDPVEPSLFVLPSGRILQIENSEVPGIYGTRVRITLRVSDVEGRVATDERGVTVVPWAAQDGGP
jgi:hypothetical protein